MILVRWIPEPQNRSVPWWQVSQGDNAKCTASHCHSELELWPWISVGVMVRQDRAAKPSGQAPGSQTSSLHLTMRQTLCLSSTMRPGTWKSRKAHILGLGAGELRGLKEVSCHVRTIRQSFGVSCGEKARPLVNSQRVADEAPYEPFFRLSPQPQASFQRLQPTMNRWLSLARPSPESLS